jgi:hypothetical protein
MKLDYFFHCILFQLSNIYKTQMGTIIADSSHFTALHRNFMQRQVTVMLAGFLSLIAAFQRLSENAALIPLSGCVTTWIQDDPLSFLRNRSRGKFWRTERPLDLRTGCIAASLR